MSGLIFLTDQAFDAILEIIMNTDPIEHAQDALSFPPKRNTSGVSFDWATDSIDTYDIDGLFGLEFDDVSLREMDEKYHGMFSSMVGVRTPTDTQDGTVVFVSFSNRQRDRFISTMNEILLASEL